ncbi:LLM class flavin-dependent oxidoreductase [Rubrobacter indicoceani]|uniref:LLM class flavin-dependent oxidoreductase n=1 Tax=Rubrobacter indicoceani TaxID=2051957 RepID=UPI0019691856|nr:LLM class flavin-dependent oxidoreductase [Rubrobacter indicoceani]
MVSDPKGINGTIEVAVMMQDQDGLNWSLWKRIARKVENSGFAGLCRSDRSTSPDGPLGDNQELWSSLLWLADNTERVEIGPLGSPLSFRDPRITAGPTPPLMTSPVVVSFSGPGRSGPRTRGFRLRPS